MSGGGSTNGRHNPMASKPAIAGATRPAVARSPLTAGDSVTLTIPGPPRTKKTSNKIWMVGNRKVVKPSDAWLEWRDAVMAWWLQQPASFGVRVVEATRGVDMNCAAIFYRDARRGDATGYYQGLADVLEDCGIIPNDRFLTQWDGSRLAVDKQNPRVVVTLTPVGA